MKKWFHTDKITTNYVVMSAAVLRDMETFKTSDDMLWKVKYWKDLKANSNVENKMWTMQKNRFSAPDMIVLSCISHRCVTS